MIKAKVAFLKGRFFSSLSGHLKTFQIVLDWLDKNRPSKKATVALIMQTG